MTKKINSNNKQKRNDDVIKMYGMTETINPTDRFNNI